MENITTKDVKNYYDEFTQYELKAGVNLRHLSIFNKLISEGLKRHHHVLEIGCGIGQVSGLMHGYLTSGHLTSVDISPGSVAVAQKRIGPSGRMTWVVSDMSDFTTTSQFDFAVLPDVLEHIPVDQHQTLFHTIRRHLKDTGKIVIHIPHPDLIDYDQQHHPERLQIIDQALAPAHLLQVASTAGFYLKEFKAYSLFYHEPDYIFMVLEGMPHTAYRPLPKSAIIKAKTKQRIRRWMTGIGL